MLPKDDTNFKKTEYMECNRDLNDRIESVKRALFRLMSMKEYGRVNEYAVFEVLLHGNKVQSVLEGDSL